MAEMGRLFERVVVISLDRSGDRREAFYRELPKPWPFAPPEVMRAIDGRKVPPPPSYQARPPVGSWGCFRSHYRVLEDALNDGVDSVLVFEDDVAFVPEFAERAQEFFTALPADWEFIYLGGKHLHREIQLPIRVNAQVYRPFNVHSAFAYGLRGRSAIARVYEHINSPERWQQGHCIDHRLGEMHDQYPGGVYTPARWLVGHRAGRSTIRRTEYSREFFPDADWLWNAPVAKPFVLAVGNDVRLTCAVVSALHLLGVPFGEHRRSERQLSPRIAQTVAPGLNRLVDHLYDPRWWQPRTDFDHRVAMLRQWASRRSVLPTNQEYPVLGAYHECLTLMGPEVCAAWDYPTLLIVEAETPRTLPAQTNGAATVRNRKIAAAWQNIAEADFGHRIRCTESELRDPVRCLERIANELNIPNRPERLAAASEVILGRLRE